MFKWQSMLAACGHEHMCLVKGFASERTACSSEEFLKKYVRTAFLATALVSSGCAFVGDGGATASSVQPNVVYRVMSSPSAGDVGTNSNYPLDPDHTVRVMSSPSASDVGTNSNYPLDPAHMVAVDNSSVVMPSNDGPVQSANSLSQPIDTTPQFARERTQPVVHSN